ncbi:MAG TPA: TlpA disulfide reductase family protein, partial [Puia sp.]|nr:TlpA disulfide reductase family protein [Puia sp.]
VPVINGKFLIKGKLQGPVKLMLFCNGVNNERYGSKGFYLDTGTQTVVCKKDTTGYNREIPDIHNETMNRYIHSYMSSEWQALDTVSDFYQQVKMKRSYIREYVKKYPGSYVSLWEIAENLRNGYDPVLDSGFSYLSSELKSGYSGRQLANDLRHLRLTAIGKPFPIVSYFDMSGKRKQISYPAPKIKYTLVDFWFSHCSACILQFRDYIKIINNYKNKGFALIGISTDISVANITAWKNVIREKSLNWAQYRTDDASVKKLRINGFPANFLLDSQGVIIAKDLEPQQLADFLKEKLN